MPKSVAAYRKARAVELALGGASYDEIAQEVGYANRGTAWRTVQRALHDREVAAVDEYRELELARLDALQGTCWERALDGDIDAVAAVVRIIEQRSRLLGLTGTSMATRAGNRQLLVG